MSQVHHQGPARPLSSHTFASHSLIPHINKSHYPCIAKQTICKHHHHTQLKPSLLSQILNHHHCIQPKLSLLSQISTIPSHENALWSPTSFTLALFAKQQQFSKSKVNSMTQMSTIRTLSDHISKSFIILNDSGTMPQVEHNSELFQTLDQMMNQTGTLREISLNSYI